MIPFKFYHKTGKWWEGQRVITVREIKTRGGLIFPRGRLCTVKGKRRGLTIEGEPCKHCGVRMMVMGVELRDIRWLPGYPKTPKEKLDLVGLEEIQ